VKFIAFLICLGGAFGVLHLFVKNQAAAGGLSWLLGGAVYFLGLWGVRVWQMRQFYE